MDISGSSLVTVESTAEWQINDILSDGQERYLQPLVFSDYVAKYARKVDWQKQVKLNKAGTSDTDDVVTDHDEDDTDHRSSTSAPSKVRRVQPQTTRPFEPVLKSLNTALIELNGMLDLLTIVHHNYFLSVQRVSTTKQDETMHKIGILFSKRKATAACSKILQGLLEKLNSGRVQLTNAGSGPPTGHQPLSFQGALLKLRRYWRLKKVGNLILGDLAPIPTGSKFRPDSTFEIERALPGDNATGEPLKIKLPDPLKKNLRLHVSVLHKGRPIVYCDSFLREAIPNQAGVECRLHLAQRTLLTKDVFQRLSQEAVSLQTHSCTVSQSVIVINIFPDTSLVISIRDEALEDPEIFDNDDYQSTKPMCSYRLTDLIGSLICAEFLSPAVERHIRPVSTPHLAVIDRKRRYAGPLGFDEVDLQDSAKRSLIDRMIVCAQHFVLAEQTHRSLEELCLQVSDPHLSVHRMQFSSDDHSNETHFLLHIIHTENPRQKYVLSIDVCEDLINFAFKDSDIATCRTVEHLISAIHLQIAQLHVSAIEMLAKRLNSWHVVGSSGFARSDSQPASTILISHQNGSRAICVKYQWNKEVDVLMADEKNATQGECMSDLLEGARWKHLRGAFCPISLDGVLGNTLLQKLENLMMLLT